MKPERFWHYLIALLALAMLLPAAAGSEAAGGMTLSPESAVLTVKETCLLTVEGFLPASETDALAFQSDAPEVAKVDDRGKVTAVKAGEARVTAYSTEDPGQSAVCTVTVFAAPTGVRLDVGKATLAMGETLVLRAEALGTDGPCDFTWKGSDRGKYARLTPDGDVCAVEGLAAGKCTVTVKTANGKSDKATITVFDPTIPTGLRLEPEGPVEQAVNDPIQLSAILLPEGTADSDVIWKSSAPKTASVDKNGLVTPLKTGSVTITARAAKNKKATAKVTLTFIAPSMPDGIRLEPEGTVTLDVNERLQLTATLLPEGTAESDILWKSGSSKVASVDENGLVTPHKAGKATITASVVKNRKITAKVKLVVKDMHAPVSVSIDQGKTAEVALGQDLSLTATVTAQEGFDPVTTLKWKSSNDKVAAVSSDGVVHGVETGKATITVTTHNKKKASCKVEVVKLPDTKVRRITLDPSGAVLMTGQTLTLTADVLPGYATNPGINWKSGDERIATVQDGAVTGVAPGEAVITARAADGGGAKATCQVTVLQSVKEIRLSQTEALVFPDGTLTLTAEVLPEDAADKALIWSSDNEAAAKVADGAVTGVAPGEAVITARAADGGGAQAACRVTVGKPVERISLTPAEARMLPGDTLTLTAEVLPEDAADKALIWSSDNEAAATVQDGVVTGVAPGEAVITARAADGGGAQAVCRVRVAKPVAQINLNVTDRVCKVDQTALGGTRYTITATVLPADADNRDLIWTCDNTDVASVSGGEVTIKALGRATITATAADGGGAHAESTLAVMLNSLTDDSGFEYAPGDGDTYRVTGYLGRETEVVVPSAIYDFAVTALGDDAFSGNTGLTAVTLGEGIEVIGDSAFDGCAALADVRLPDSVRTIGESAFEDCASLTAVVLNDGLVTIKSNAFNGCAGLTDITIPASVQSINDGDAFEDCGALTVHGAAGSCAQTWAESNHYPFVPLT